MSFDDNASLDTSQVESGGGRGRRSPGGMVVGGGIGGLVLVILALVLGINPGDVTGSAAPTEQNTVTDEGGSGLTARCRTGADANRSSECLVVGTVNSVQDYWSKALPTYGKTYTPVKTVLYSGVTRSACGTASNQVGPFYCPLDRKVYIDAAFFSVLQDRYGSSGGQLAQEYVVAHEYGHHIQDILGLLSRAQSDPQGAESGSVRIELMADCLAGVWAHHAATTKDAQGRALLKPLTQRDIKDALSAAAAVGDDSIQQKAQGRVTPESWTHGSASARQSWFTTGYTSGSLDRCDTFAARDVEKPS